MGKDDAPGQGEAEPHAASAEGTAALAAEGGVEHAADVFLGDAGGPAGAPEGCNTITPPIAYSVFVISRVLHAVVYLSARQPVRSAAWFVGVLSVLVMAALVAWSLFGSPRHGP